MIHRHTRNLVSYINFHSEGGDALEQVAQEGYGCPIPGGIQGQVGWGPGQPDLVGGNQPVAGGLELDGL